MISPKRFCKSLKFAFRGIGQVIKREHSFRIQILAAIVVLAIIFIFPLEVWEQIVLILLIGAVLVLEVINSIFERLSDGLKPRLNELVKDVKDMMAGAVLITALVAAIIASMILWPYLATYLQEFGLFQ
ncbi:MAG: hypothetical protein ACD_66C00081G0004 [uncultured bacterium]|uniref:Seg n=1 Tax=Candidatus Uhrbacteria bacterium GW2011_GWC1_41_20 TaxID=1618983 RepID=A0A0G0VE20_9BACT|nr:MAG: hypothetical protein ACD_66C00081G0004 [uncultured bacterium]KKR22567.1 MAG: hypothetical protein UT52_C0011G0017 [Candidatus Uhrbacteria bacterium GW2011_GWE1_39_46]KKR64020.1 MAG: hypothetical protein UU04_C0007G0008 [Candidatus Uhrbacteria bacterium GW2011_GWC2_40_450]KKR90120.1 MAG: hypothetical protein UU40_C0008G0017 [Candidatus Uhrbacteria bacterium GW2011_GWD2_41_121]KKR96076.1 MAG: hypothetical protein UU46_C0008G0017 [Candidatus Uhrbacteria bacterium GW2011_GWD1_41_16]KKR9911